MGDVFNKTACLGSIGCCLLDPAMQSWDCLNSSCKKREDEPSKQSQNSGENNVSDQINSTASGTTQYMTASSSTITTTT